MLAGFKKCQGLLIFESVEIPKSSALLQYPFDSIHGEDNGYKIHSFPNRRRTTFGLKRARGFSNPFTARRCRVISSYSNESYWIRTAWGEVRFTEIHAFFFFFKLLCRDLAEKGF